MMAKQSMQSFYSRLSTELLRLRLAEMEQEIKDAKPGIWVKAPEACAVIRRILAKRKD